MSELRGRPKLRLTLRFLVATMTTSIAHQISARWRIGFAAVVSMLLIALAWAPGARAIEPRLAAGTFASSMVSGPAGTVWFGGFNFPGSYATVGRVAPSGETTEFKLKDGGKAAQTHTLPGIAIGSDGNLWLTTEGETVVRATQAGELTEFKVPAKELGAIVSAPDGSLRFTSKQNLIGRLTTSGEASTVALPAGSEPTDLAVGPEGSLWVTERGGNSIARVNSDNNVNQFPLPNAGSKPNAIVLGPDGNLWFSEEGAPRIGRITPSGQITEFIVPGTAGTQLISNGPDGDLWYSQAGQVVDLIGSITTSGAVGSPACAAQFCSRALNALTPGPAGELLYATGGLNGVAGGGAHIIALEAGGTIGTFTPPPLVSEVGSNVHLGAKRVVVVPLSCGGGAAGTSCSGRVQLKNGGKAWGGIGYRVETSSRGKATVELHGRPAKALVRNGKVALTVIAFNDKGEAGRRNVVVRTNPRR